MIDQYFQEIVLVLKHGKNNFCLIRMTFDLSFTRARGGREAEREERQLWETPERKRSTKPVVNGKISLFYHR